MTLDREDIEAIAEAVARKIREPQTPLMSEQNKLWAKNPELLKEYSRRNRKGTRV